MAVGSATLLILILLLNQFLSYHPQQAAALAGQQAGAMSNQVGEEVEIVKAMGMQNAGFTKREKSRNIALFGQIRATDLSGGFSSLIKTLWLFLQCVMLGMGTYLVLKNEMSPSGMIAGQYF